MEATRRKADCPGCKTNTFCTVHGRTVKTRSSDGNARVRESCLLECQGCETVFYEETSWNMEDEVDWFMEHEAGARSTPTYKKTTTYPRPPRRPRPPWMDALLQKDTVLWKIMSETYQAYEDNSCILGVIGLRTAFDRASELLQVPEEKIFKDKLDALRDRGIIGDDERNALNVVIEAGHAAAHRGWIPDIAAMDTYLTAMEIFLQKAFILGESVVISKHLIPPRTKKPKQGPTPTTPTGTTP